MLNKLRFFRDNPVLPDLDRQRQTAKYHFTKYFGKEDIFLEDISGGTLGITFLCDGLKQSQIFVKTHLSDIAYRNALYKEYQMLKSIYHEKIFLECLHVSVGNNTELLFLLMDSLKPGCGMSKADIIELIGQYSRNDILKFDGKGMYDISELLFEAKKSLYALDKMGFYSASIIKIAESLLICLESYLAVSPRIVCHGDLADKNIMINSKDEKILLDWEDAFWGIEGYDYLYWLTFFNHRKFYNEPGIFEVAGLSPEIAAGILTLILLIKNAISYYSGEYVNNKLSMDDRLKEIYECMGIGI
jgi:hypothetical protein